MRLVPLKSALAIALATQALGAAAQQAWPPTPTVIAHRGASALRPEHTLAAYQKAIDDGADIIEPDLVITKDGVLVARHENAIAILNADGSVKEATTDVVDRPEFAARKATRSIDGQAITGWFTEDFTLAELKTLRARERIPAQRPANVAYNGQFEIPTLQEVIDLAKTQSAKTGRTIGIYPETKHPTYFQSIGQPLEAPLLAVLEKNGWNHKQAPVFVQSFEVANLQAIRKLSTVRLVQLVAPSGRPYDFVAQGAANTRSYADLVTAEGLRQVASYANAVGPFKTLVVPVKDGVLGEPTALVANARAAGLSVHIWTLRPENSFLPTSLRKAPASDATARGDSIAEITAYLRAGVDGFFTDDSAVGRAAVQAFTAK
ncbi:glycerophosphoryl diester phosphodiesterase [Acidovorax sp. CF316]|uniref:glycerophosphodiester phosphodiesterase n=1 Tax=Acidovorax sp. CF316 TaxID=1144317 RepID=UPI00026BDE6F|nr:glycerophosphodiester phosphodiesterase [Acidovorax sp. CF316]EJE53272.1 glycerophosphoryl diester phosphodiesterase [Acidovorax sp. CF316]